MTETELKFFQTHSRATDPQAHSEFLAAAPSDLGDLCAFVQNAVLHRLFAEELTSVLPAESADDASARTVVEMASRILARGPTSTSAHRPADRRLIGVCSHYALLLAALLRQRGVPARLRCGFADYFNLKPGFHDDHWVCEVWNVIDRRWQLVDAEVSDELRHRCNIVVDPFDVPRDRFLSAGAAWDLCRRGVADPSSFGVSFIGTNGEWFVASNVIRDLAALNRQEMLPWDYWGPSIDFCLTGKIAREQLPLLDEIALVTSKADFQDLRQCYEQNANLRVPKQILSYPNGEETWLELPCG